MIIRYVWQWLEYPYADYPFGAWDDEYEIVHCFTDEDGYWTLPEHEVISKGWYKGPVLLGRKPKFKTLELSVENYHVWMNQKEIAKSEKVGTVAKPFSLKRPDGYEGLFRIEVHP